MSPVFGTSVGTKERVGSTYLSCLGLRLVKNVEVTIVGSGQPELG